MDFDQLTTFLEVAKLGSFSRAGQKVFRSQSAVSAQIRLLEQDYGDRLLDRSGKDVSLTPAGRVLFAYAERLLQMRDESLLAVADQGSTPRGTIAIGANEATCLYVLPDVFCQILPSLSGGADQHLSELQLQNRGEAGKWFARCRHRDVAREVPEPEDSSHLSRPAHADGQPAKIRWRSTMWCRSARLPSIPCCCPKPGIAAA